MRLRFRWLVAFFFLVTLGTLRCSSGECKKDLDCRAPRICEQGVCIAPETTQESNSLESISKEPTSEKDSDYKQALVLDGLSYSFG